MKPQTSWHLPEAYGPETKRLLAPEPLENRFLLIRVFTIPIGLHYSHCNGSVQPGRVIRSASGPTDKTNMRYRGGIQMTQQRQPLFVRLPFYFPDGVGEGDVNNVNTAEIRPGIPRTLSNSRWDRHDRISPDTAGLAAFFPAGAAHFGPRLSFRGVRPDEK